MIDTQATWRDALLRYVAFDKRGNAIRVCLAVCVLTALVSLLLGQDANWDLRNYHLYNGWAVLHGRLSIDLAPAQMQSYFVPWLDVGYYLLAVKGSPLLAGAVLGLFHGLAFAAVAAVAWLVLKGDPRRAWLAPLLALAGCLGSAVFVSELGNTMGDNTTAPLAIGALAFALHAARTDAAQHWLLAGLLLGLALGLKLTNMPYALGLGLAALATCKPWIRRLRGAALLTVAALAVFVLVAGPWFYWVWKQFGNPLFPQLNQWFHAPLAWPNPNTDTTWVPKKIGHMLTWPLLIAAKPGRIGERRLMQLAFGMLYLLAVWAILRALVARRIGHRRQSGLPTPDPAARMIAVFITVAFAAWMALFSIHRYLVTLELLAPLALWLLARYALPAASAEKWAACLVAVCTVAGGRGGVVTLDQNWFTREAWARRGFAVDAPPMKQPETATVLLVGDEPQAWRIPFLSRQVAYIGIFTYFPASPAYGKRVRQMVAQRGGKVYAMFPAVMEGAPCRCWLDQSDAKGADNQNRLSLDRYAYLRDYDNWQLKPETCTVHASYIGHGNYPFQWCEVERLP